MLLFKGQGDLGAVSTGNNIPLLFFFSLSLLFFLFCAPSLCRPSSALLISLRYGSQWHLISLLCNNQSCCFFLMLSQPRPLILLVYQLAVYDACGTSRCGGWGGWRTPSTLPTCARRWIQECISCSVTGVSNQSVYWWTIKTLDPLNILMCCLAVNNHTFVLSYIIRTSAIWKKCLRKSEWFLKFVSYLFKSLSHALNNESIFNFKAIFRHFRSTLSLHGKNVVTSVNDTCKFNMLNFQVFPVGMLLMVR